MERETAREGLGARRGRVVGAAPSFRLGAARYPRPGGRNQVAQIDEKAPARLCKLMQR